MNDGGHESRQEARRTKAELHRSWWPGWIWAIPIAAILLVAWWLLRTFMSSGQDITITFDDVHGLKASNANVLYRGMVVGTVGDMQLAKDGKSVAVGVHIDADATRFLTTGTEFWLRGTSPSISDLSTLGSVVSGPTII
ncbi:MAG: MlaD family protein, partial [Stellaceae bacterium]